MASEATNEAECGHPTITSAADAAQRARPLSEYHEDIGPVLWWRFPITEPPYVGSPFDTGPQVLLQIIGADDPMLSTSFSVGGWPGHHTHWTPIPIPVEPSR